jgi:hypothetical protein
MAKLYKWRIYQIRKKGVFLGLVEAPDDRDEAEREGRMPAPIMAAIERFDVTDPEQQKRLSAVRVE